MNGPVLVIHGGAGVVDRGPVPPSVDLEYHAALKTVLELGSELLSGGTSAVEVAVQAVKMLEDCPLFNAGRGSVFTDAEDFEMDAAIMDGATLAAGAVAGLRRIRNPVTAAYALMREGRCVMLAGQGAEQFALAQGCMYEKKDYFFTESRHAQLLAVRARDAQAMALDHSRLEPVDPLSASKKYGTVGCVVRDSHGQLASAVSTGGLTNKRSGRIGDTPIIGAGCYANNRSAAIAAAGTGEVFMRAVVGHELSASMIHGGLNIQKAADQVMHTVTSLGGYGGVIAVDGNGCVAMSLNTQGMYRGIGRPGQTPQTMIYR